eukprot:GHRQ01028889.1.p1 GENE.GHRQ01028889.1~~GHRQ01028889.1.p1  ORF type:complete len:112 (+),score=25.50 GHRQ01028889.1:297-632(+)
MLMLCYPVQVVGMGLLLTFIGLQSSKIVVPDQETMVAMGDLLGLEPVLAIGGLAVIAALHFRCACCWGLEPVLVFWGLTVIAAVHVGCACCWGRGSHCCAALQVGPLLVLV